MANSQIKELKVTQQNALQMALKYVNENLKTTDTQLTRQYGLNRSTLARIRKGELLTLGYDKYLRVMVVVLNKARTRGKSYAQLKEEDPITRLMRDLLLVHFQIPTDAEKRNWELHQKYGV